MKLTETDWKRHKINRHGLKVDDGLEENPLKSLKIGFGDFAWKVGPKKHLTGGWSVSIEIRYGRLGVPPWSLFFCQKITAISRLLPLEFWCSEGHFAQFDLILTLFWPILTCFDLFWRADLNYFHLFRPIRRADLTYFHLFRPISFHTKAPWTGHLIYHRVLQGAAQRGRQFYFIFVVLQTLAVKHQNEPFLS